MTNEEMKAAFKEAHDQSQYINWDAGPIEVCHSNAGYYIGIMEEGLPLVRLSCEYFPTFEAAQAALDTGKFDAKLWL